MKENQPMDNKHTPGPWHANGTQIIGKAGKRNQYVADIDRNAGVETAHANAKLIAAAPDLLAALKEVLFIVEAAHEVPPTRANQARAAIEKATT